jgi:hypothetical protein
VTERLKHELQGIGAQAAARAADIPHDGLILGDKENTLFTGGRGDWEAPKVHPVWAPEVARAAEIVERLAAATVEHEPLRRTLSEWAAAGKPEVRGEEDMQGLKARMETLAGQRPEAIAERMADLLEEAGRQGLVVTGQEMPPETHTLKQQKRMGY